jgi:hypothetical protein
MSILPISDVIGSIDFLSGEVKLTMDLSFEYRLDIGLEKKVCFPAPFFPAFFFLSSLPSSSSFDRAIPSAFPDLVKKKKKKKRRKIVKPGKTEKTEKPG